MTTLAADSILAMTAGSTPPCCVVAISKIPIGESFDWQGGWMMNYRQVLQLSLNGYHRRASPGNAIKRHSENVVAVQWLAATFAYW